MVCQISRYCRCRLRAFPYRSHSSYLDDLIIVPLGIWLVVSLIPEQIMDEYRAIANEAGQRPVSRAGMITIIVLWIFGALTLGWIGYALWSRPD